MSDTATTAPPLTRACTWRLTHSGQILTITVERLCGKRKKPLTVVYLVVRKAPDLIQIIKDDGEVYTVSKWSCTCKDSQFSGSKGIRCKHRTSCLEAKLLGEIEVDA